MTSKFKSKLIRFIRSEDTLKEILDWLFFALFLVPYIWYVLPWVKENMKTEFRVFLFGFTAGIVMMIISKLFVRFVFFPMLKYLKMWYHSGEENDCDKGTGNDTE